MSQTVLGRLKRSRTAARGWLSRAAAKLQEAVESKEVDIFMVKNLIADFDKRLASWDDAQKQVELEIEEESLDMDQQEASEFRDQMMVTRYRADKVKVSHSAEADCVSVTGMSHKLPKLNLPKFGGDASKWTGFWESFEVSVHKTDLPDVTKMTYLRSLLTDEAEVSVAGLRLSSDNYEATVKILKDRYGRPERIVFSHVQSLLSLGCAEFDSLKKLKDRLLVHIRSLEALGVGGEMYGVILTPLILSKLPETVRMEWARQSSGKEGDLPYLMEFLSAEIRRQELSGAYGGLSAATSSSASSTRPAKDGHPTSGGHSQATSRHSQQERRRSHPSSGGNSAAALQAASQQTSQQVCGFCKKVHSTEQCPGVIRLPVRERMRRVRFSGLCFRCLKYGHQAKDCGAQCEICSGHHHRICCFGGPAGTDQVVKGVPSGAASVGEAGRTQGVKVSLSCNSGDDKCVVLPSASVLVQGVGGPVHATLLFDTGSDRTYVSEALMRRVGMGAKWLGTESVTYAAFGGGRSSCDRNVWEMWVCGANLSHPEGCSVTAVQVPVICSPLQRPQISREALVTFTGVELADSYDADRVMSVDILVGLDQYWKLVGQGFIRHSEGSVVAQETQFGWIVSGVTSRVPGASGGAVCQLLTLGDLHENTVRRLWDLEGIGIHPDEEPAESKVLEEFNSSVHLSSEGRYEVGLPWKVDGAQRLEDNRSSAEGRLAGLTRRLDRDPVLSERYSAALREMEQSGVIEEVPSEELVSPHPTFYLPHHPVVKESSSSTKVRPVFDASASGPNGVSLNDCVESGPSLIPSLVEVLLRFRRWRFAVTADIVKAFLQLQLRREDRDVHRFLWQCDGRVRVMRFMRVTFGVSSSPFLLNATISHHLSRYYQSRAVTEMQSNFYVDDLISGADTEEEARDLLTEAQSVMADAGMVLSKYTSNSPVVFDSAVSESSGAEGIKVLGVRWIPDEDVFTFDGVMIPDDVVPTKRVVLSFIARLFDPLGLLTPVTMVAKCLFQTLWQLGLQWDEPLPEESRSIVMRWLRGLESLKQFRVSRAYSVLGWSGDEGAMELHAFGDASPDGYGAAVYLRTPLPDGSFSVSLVLAKGRVAPVKRVSLPRLELLGGLLAARLVTYVRQALRLPDSTICRCWSDSMIVLGWIRGDPQRWKQFVYNRVSEIHSLTDPSSWAFVPGEDNPSDLTTRGVSAEHLLDSKEWLTGPSWLSESSGQPLPSDRSEPSVSETPEEEVVLTAVSATVPCERPVFDVERWSSLSKAVRVVAWTRRFVHNARNPAQRCSLSDLSGEEVAAARDVLLRQAQREAFPEEIKALEQERNVSVSSPIRSLTPYLADGVLRMRGRLQFSELCFEEKHPVIVPKGHLAVLLVREQHALLKHAGVTTLITAVRSSMWVVGLRGIARRVVRSCVICRRHDSRACCEPAAPLPSDRVSRTPPFSVVGIDFAGPLFAADFPKKKLYVCLFTCAVTRALHLELTGSLTLAEFMLAFRRFAARRGVPSTVYSDNACTFKGADAQLRRYFGRLAPVWKFIVPQSPWWGGWWERLVRSVKVALRKSLAQRFLSRVELETVLSEIEACINSRPITFVGDTVDSPTALTPNHFLTGHSVGFQAREAEDPSAVTARALGERARVRERRLNRFWTVWSDEYLRNLPPAVSKFKSRGTLCEGSVVLVQNENTPRMRWELGVVTRLFPGRDGVVRSAEVRTAGGKKTRSIQRLHDLEVSADV